MFFAEFQIVACFVRPALFLPLFPKFSLGGASCGKNAGRAGRFEPLGNVVESRLRRMRRKPTPTAPNFKTSRRENPVGSSGRGS